MRRELGIDLGASTLTVSAPNEGIILREPSFVAKSRTDDRNLLFGVEAKRLLEQGANCALARPFKDSLCSRGLTVPTITYLLNKSNAAKDRNRVIIGSPCGDSESREAALIELAAQAGIYECYLVYTPIAAAIGEGLDFDRARCILEIGAARSNILLTGNGKLLYKETTRAAGDAFDHAIMTYLENQHHMKISTHAAEQIKCRIGTVWTSTDRQHIEVTGRHIRTDEIVKKRIWSDELLIAFEEPMAELLETVCRALHKLPSEFARDVLEDGIFLCGGGSLLDGIARMIFEITHIKVVPSRQPRDVVAGGLMHILEKMPEKMPTSVGNITAKCINMFARQSAT